MIRILTCPYEMLCRICIVQIQPRKHVLDHAGCTAPIRQHEVDPTDQEYICRERPGSWTAGIDDLICPRCENITVQRLSSHPPKSLQFEVPRQNECCGCFCEKLTRRSYYVALVNRRRDLKKKKKSLLSSKDCFGWCALIHSRTLSSRACERAKQRDQNSQWTFFFYLEKQKQKMVPGWNYSTEYFIKNWKTSAVSTTVWMVETQLCKLRGTSDAFV